MYCGFPALTAKALVGLKLLPGNVEQLSQKDVAELEESYGPDLPPQGSLSGEVRISKKKWERSTFISQPNPQSLHAIIAVTWRLVFPNIHRILYFLLIPLASARVERANSAIKQVKSVLRSTMQQDRLNGFLVMYVHKDIPNLDCSAIIDKYSRKHPRRTLFLHPLSSRWDCPVIVHAAAGESVPSNQVLVSKASSEPDRKQIIKNSASICLSWWVCRGNVSYFRKTAPFSPICWGGMSPDPLSIGPTILPPIIFPAPPHFKNPGSAPGRQHQIRHVGLSWSGVNKFARPTSNPQAGYKIGYQTVSL